MLQYHFLKLILDPLEARVLYVAQRKWRLHLLDLLCEPESSKFRFTYINLQFV